MKTPVRLRIRVPASVRRAAVAALALCAGVAHADERLEARRHFRNGMSLIAAGQHEAGISELKAAYAIKPHPSVLYNIARAHADAGQVQEAVEYYRIYLSTNPPDLANVQAQLARLEATLKAAEAPAPAPQVAAAAPATGAPSGGVGVKVNGLPMPPPPGASNPQRDAQLAQLLERLEKAIARAESMSVSGGQGVEGLGASATTVLPGLPGVTAPGGLTVVQHDAEDVGTEAYEERVVTASRRAQSSLEAPNALTVITAEDIRLSGATSVQQLLRRVPGADVMEMGVGSADVSMRGFNQRLANKVLVLIDGRTEYQDFLGTVLWSAFPVGMDEIERIEVVRGPGSALYGANAMLGVINIITKAPGTGPRVRFSGMGGVGNTAGASFTSHGGEGRLGYRASAGYVQADKWSRDFADGRQDVAFVGPVHSELGLRSVRGNLDLRYQVARGIEVQTSAGANRFYSELYPVGLLRNFYIDGMTAYAKTDASVGPMHLKLFWNHLATDAGPQYEAVGARSLANSLTNNVFNGELLFSKTVELAGEHQFNLGVEGRVKNIDWSYLGGKRRETHLAGFATDEWQPVQPLRVSASIRVDRHPLIDDGEPGLLRSPRVAGLFMITPQHAVRASYASAFREPTFLESYTQLRTPAPGVNGASVITRGVPSLNPERLTALELGYRGEAPTLGAEWDVALYQNKVKDLIGLSAIRPVGAGGAYDPATGSYLLGESFFQNEPDEYTARGLELGLRMAPIDGLGVQLSTAWQRINDDDRAADACAPCSQAPTLKVFAGVTYRTRSGVTLGMDATYTGKTKWIEREPSAADPTVIQNVENPLQAYTAINARIAYELVKNKAELAMVGNHLTAAHFQHPFGNRIDRRYFATLTLTP